MFRSGTWPSSGVYYIKLRNAYSEGASSWFQFHFNLYKMHGEYNIKFC
jgi:hypothetical protein